MVKYNSRPVSVEQESQLCQIRPAYINLDIINTKLKLKDRENVFHTPETCCVTVTILFSNTRYHHKRIFQNLILGYFLYANTTDIEKFEISGIETNTKEFFCRCCHKRKY